MTGMTGYGLSTSNTSKAFVQVVIKSWNSKFLDIHFYSPQSFSRVEEPIKDILRTRTSRGKIEIAIQYHEHDSHSGYEIDEHNVKKAIFGLTKVKEMLGDQTKLTAESVAGSLQTIFMPEKDLSDDKLDLVVSVFKAAFEEFLESREREGSKVLSDLKELLDKIDYSRSLIVQVAPSVQENLKKSIRERFTEVLGDLVEENRVLQEIGLALVRYSVYEELSRLTMHIEKARELVQQAGPVAKRLDFLCQELHREANTLGSKSIDAGVSHIVIDIKEAIDAMREQIRNIE